MTFTAGTAPRGLQNDQNSRQVHRGGVLELCDSFEDGHIDQNALIEIATKREAEAGGADRQSDMHTSDEKVTTSPEHVYIPQENVHVPPDGKVACPIATCRAELMPGQHCSGVGCGLRGK